MRVAKGTQLQSLAPRAPMYMHVSLPTPILHPSHAGRRTYFWKSLFHSSTLPLFHSSRNMRCCSVRALRCKEELFFSTHFFSFSVLLRGPHDTHKKRIYACIPAYIHTSHTYIHTAHTYIGRVHTYMCTHTYKVYIHKCTYICRCTHTCRNTQTHTCSSSTSEATPCLTPPPLGVPPPPPLPRGEGGT